MDITAYAFSQEAIEQLRQYRDAQRDGRLKIRCIGLLMLAESMSIEQTASSMGRSVKTLMNWGCQHLIDGIACLNTFNPFSQILSVPEFHRLDTGLFPSLAPLKDLRAMSQHDSHARGPVRGKM
jgi:hypothetical protein